ncbi:hypothetical protein GIB67_040697 [Kingdonia uniflora]|uniref:RING-type domain-containing protein n=1 Tax=Kingdonia uniflora TaxID=39325 RepID=A0A7J7KU97_9MAGN|nr:hypothetical protein GIB67_040697 [Kingdonia uniflora]
MAIAQLFCSVRFEESDEKLEDHCVQPLVSFKVSFKTIHRWIGPSSMTTDEDDDAPIVVLDENNDIPPQIEYFQASVYRLSEPGLCRTPSLSEFLSMMPEDAYKDCKEYIEDSAVNVEAYIRENRPKQTVLFIEFTVLNTFAPCEEQLEEFIFAESMNHEDEIVQLVQEESMEEAENFTPVPALRSAVEALEIVKEFNEGDTEMNMSCIVCLEKFSSGVDIGLRLPCSHIYHKHCIVPWFEEHNICPLCRFELPVELMEIE